jgi:predicted nucleic acid-binding protein
MWMQLLVSDANILIDMEEGNIMEELFKLPYDIAVSDILYADELEEQHSHLLQMGLSQAGLRSVSVQYAIDLITRARGPSRCDCLSLALAKQEGCTLLSGDKDLRELAKEEGVNVKGTLWIVESLVEHNFITIEKAGQAYDKMKANGRRLPWDLAKQGLKKYKPQ